MRLATSCYSSATLVTESKMDPVRISVGHPRFGTRFEMRSSSPLLYPTRDMLKLGTDEYRERYYELLEQRGVEQIKADLERLDELAGGRGLVLLCFEDLRKPELWCHRRMFADWWQERTGESVPELGM